MSSRETLLLLFILATGTHQSAIKCSSIRYLTGPKDRSTTAPEVANGTDITLFQLFATDGDPHNLRIAWTRIPFHINFTTEDIRMENTVVDNRTLNASLILRNIQLIPGGGTYTVNATNDCGSSNKTNFYLRVVPCNINAIPQPMIVNNSTTLAEPNLGEYVQLTATFNGSMSLDYITLWYLDGRQICLESSRLSVARYSCNRFKLDHPCSFQANLWIYNPSYTSSGNYSVLAAISDYEGNVSNIYLEIERQPEVKSCVPETVTYSSKQSAQFQCTVSNYSDTVQVVVEEDNEIKYNESTAGLSFGCKPHVIDSTLATCTVNISSSVHSTDKREYKLCVGYGSSVSNPTPMECSESVTVSFSGETKGKSKLTIGLGTGVPGLSLLLVVGVIVVLCVIRSYRRSSDNVPLAVDDGPTRPLLHPSTDLILGRDGGHGTVTDRSRRVQSGMNPKSAIPEIAEFSYPTQDDTATVDRGVSPLWPRVNNGPIEQEKLVRIAKIIGRWKDVARSIGIDESDIDVISHNHPDYAEQRYQMLHRWCQQQETPTNQTLVRTIEEKVSPELSQKIINIVNDTENS